MPDTANVHQMVGMRGGEKGEGLGEKERDRRGAEVERKRVGRWGEKEERKIFKIYLF